MGDGRLWRISSDPTPRQFSADSWYDLRLIIGAAVSRKRAAHAGMLELAATGNRPMITIGG